MNSLSWFIYLAQAVDSLRTSICVFAGLTIAALFLTGIPALIGKLDKFMGDGSFYALWVPWVKKLLPIAVLVLVFANFIPDRGTLLLIASSEMGERFAKSDAAQSIVNPGIDLLKTWIRAETEKLAANSARK